MKLTAEENSQKTIAYIIRATKKSAYRYFKFLGRKARGSDIRKVIIGRAIAINELTEVQNKIIDIYYVWENHHATLAQFFRIGCVGAYKNEMSFRVAFESYFTEPRTMTKDNIQRRRKVLNNLETYAKENNIEEIIK